MATDPIEINIKNLPQVNTIQAGDFLVVEQPDGTGIIDFDNIIIDLQHVTFEGTIDALVTGVIALSSNFATLSSNVYSDLEQKIVGNIAVFKNIGRLTTDQNFEGTGVKLPLNYIEVNNISNQQTVEVSPYLACGDNTLSQTASAFVFDSGTYRTRIDMHVTSLCATPSWMQIYLYQETSPNQVLQHGSALTFTDANQQGNLFIDGYFYLCRTSQITLKADTYGLFNLGQPTFTISTTASANQALSATLLRTIQASACNISMFIEKVSDNPVPSIYRLGTTLL